jgi:quercetin dioxygenase-like cupin family protein
MKTRHRALAVAAVAVASVCGISALNAQQPQFSRKMMQDQELSAQDRHAVVAVAEFIPGGAVGKHTHPGEELGYVMEGSLLLTIEGQPPRTVNAGEVFFVPAGKVHEGKNTGASPAKVLSTYIVEKGKPLATSVN